MRDDFTSPIKTTIARRAGHLCSNPHCRRLTVGAAHGHDGSQNIGVIAHITAASPGGARYDANLTPQQRGGADNGLLLCQTHAHLVDHDEKTFTVEVLRKWKLDAERYSSESLLGLGTPGGGMPDTAAIKNRLDAAGGAAVDAIATKVVRVARTDVASFKTMPGWPQHPVELTLRLKDASTSRPFQVSGLAAAVEAFNEFTVIAPPGTGKTTTMLQTADAIHTARRQAALFIPLGEWSAQGRDFLLSVLARPAYAGVNEIELRTLAEHGRLTLLLDGWNELDGEARKRATAELRTLQRAYPRLCVIISTRRQALDLPIGGQQVEIDLLSDEQQIEIARAYRGDEGVKLVDAAWRTHGLRELVTIPLYLTTLLVSTTGAALPTTKEEVLRLFAQQHERVPEKAEALNEALFGSHSRLLTALAVEATGTANTAISDTRSRAVAKSIGDQLIVEGQITVAPQPATVLDILVSRHSLVRSTSGALSFQHQQFQEWYASFEVEETMRRAAEGDVAAAERLRAEFLDKRAWEEPLLFACERASRESVAGAHAVAQAVLSALSVDPTLAAEIIYRSSEAVWQEVAERTVTFVNRWHTPSRNNRTDRAVRFMVASGRPEFAASVWPMVESTDSQVYVSVMRVARRFRPSVLGPDAAKRLAAIPDETRRHVLAELARRSEIDGMELATAIAKNDPSAEVQFAVIQALLFRRGDRLALELLKSAPDAVWATLARRGYSEEITEPAAAERLSAEREKLRRSKTEPAEILGMMANEAPSPDIEQTIVSAIASPEFPARDQHAGAELHRVFERHPEAVARGIVRRLEAGLKMPYYSDDYITKVPPTDTGPVAALALNIKAPMDAARVAGPQTTGALIQTVIDEAVRIREATPEARVGMGEELRMWEDRLSVTPEESFVAAVAIRQADESLVAMSAIAEAIGRHGSLDQDKSPLALGGAAQAVMALLRVWVEKLIADPGSTRGQLWYVAIAIGRLARPELLDILKRLRDEDARRWKDAREQTRGMRGRAPIDLRSDASTSYTLQYRDAFVRMGDAAIPVLIGYLEDEQFGVDAAWALAAIFEKTHGIERKQSFFRRWPHLREAAQRRAQGPLDGDTKTADAMFAAVERLMVPGSTTEQHALAIAIARVAITLPHKNKEDLIARVMALPRPIRTKCELIAALVMSGQTFSVDLALTAIAEWIEDAKQNTWRFEQGMWEVIGWLELLPFSDRPAALLDGVQMVNDVLPKHQRVEMDRIVNSAGAAPGISDAQLVELRQRFPGLARQHEWAEAFLDRGTPSAAMAIVEMVKAGLLASGQNPVDNRWLADRLAALAKQHAELKAAILREYEVATSPVLRLLERAVQEIGGADCVLALVRGYARTGKAFDGSLHQTLEHTAVEHQPVGTSNVYNLHPVSIAPLRKELFAMMHGTDTKLAEVARAALDSIDIIRDYYGAVESEPRHPDVASGKPWPPEAG